MDSTKKAKAQMLKRLMKNLRRANRPNRIVAIMWGTSLTLARSQRDLRSLHDLRVVAQRMSHLSPSFVAKQSWLQCDRKARLVIQEVQS